MLHQETEQDEFFWGEQNRSPERGRALESKEPEGVYEWTLNVLRCFSQSGWRSRHWSGHYFRL